MADTAGTAGAALSPESPVTSDDIAAFANAEAAPSAAPPSDSSSTPAPAIAAPATDGSVVPEGAGPIPFDRHKAILEKAREESRAATEREFRQRFGWAEQYQPEQVQNGTRLMQWLNADPRGFMTWLSGQIGYDGASQAPRQAQDTAPPQPDLRAEDGTPVYSAPQQQKLLEWMEQKTQRMIEPLQRQLSEQQERGRLQQTAREAKQQAGQLYKAAQSWPMFADLQPQILHAMKADPALSFQDAYIRVFQAEGQTKLREQWLTELRGTLARKQEASTSPPGTPINTPKKYADMDVGDVVKQEWEAMSRKR